MPVRYLLIIVNEGNPVGRFVLLIGLLLACPASIFLYFSSTSAMHRAEAVSPERMWARGVSTMDSADRAHLGRREISRALQLNEPLSAEDVNNINGILHSPLIPVADINIMRATFVDALALDANSATDPRMLRRADEALSVACAALSNIALDQFAAATREPVGARVNWADYIARHREGRDGFFAEPMHMTAIVLSLWRAHRWTEASALAELMFRLPSWEIYRRTYPCDAIRAINHCARRELIVSNLPGSDVLGELRARCSAETGQPLPATGSVARMPSTASAHPRAATAIDPATRESERRAEAAAAAAAAAAAYQQARSPSRGSPPTRAMSNGGSGREAPLNDLGL